MARMREIVARVRGTPQAGDNEGQLLKLDMRAVEIWSIEGYCFTRD